MVIKEYCGFFGDCKDEQSFKKKYLRLFEYRLNFCIETEETVLGFPDVLVLDGKGLAEFYEFKFTNNGTIKFQPSQVAFYRKYCMRLQRLSVRVVAYNRRTDSVHIIDVRELFDKESPYFLHDGVGVSLKGAENEGDDSKS